MSPSSNIKPLKASLKQHKESGMSTIEQAREAALERPYWSRKHLVEMYHKDIARMLQVHPDRVDEGLKRRLRQHLPSSPPEPIASYRQVGEVVSSPRMRVVRDVCKRHRVTREQLFSHEKRQALVNARFEAWYRLYTEADMSLLAIGRWFGRDHTTILNGIRRQRERLEVAA